MSKNVIDMRAVSKQFGKKAALDGVDLKIGPGTIVGLIGSNGCGKSTLIRTVIGLYLPSAGQCHTFDRSVESLGAEDLARIGYVHQEGQLLDWMTIRQQIDYVAAYYPNWNRKLQERFVAQFELEINDRVGKLSPGKRQQLAILLATCHEPELLLLDEPASALDPIARSHFLNLLLEIIQNEGRTIIISSHILSDIEKIIDHVIIMDKGRIIVNRPFDDLRDSFFQVRLTGLTGRPFFAGGQVIQSRVEAGGAVLTLTGIDQEQIEAQARTLGCDCQIRSLTLEEIYSSVMSRDNGKATVH